MLARCACSGQEDLYSRPSVAERKGMDGVVADHRNGAGLDHSLGFDGGCSRAWDVGGVTDAALLKGHSECLA